MTLGKNYQIIGIGNAITDIVCLVEEFHIKELGLVKGSMSLIDQAKLKTLSSCTFRKITSGGSVANSIALLSQLGMSSALIGNIGDDQFGKYYLEKLKDTGVDFLGETTKEEPSACSFILITPDAQRTMATFLGCASSISKAKLDKVAFDAAKILYLEGYLWDKQETIETIRHAIHLTSKNQCQIAFSLSDPFCVDRHRNDFLELTDQIDILFGNEDEIISLLQLGYFDEDALKRFSLQRPNLLIVITRSEKGCVVITGGVESFSPPCYIEELVDTTGAGDAFAAGFLFGLSNNLSVDASAKFANFLASKTIQKLGARL